MSSKKIPEIHSLDDLAKAIKESNWKIAIPESVEKQYKIKGLIIGSDEYINYALNELPEDYIILDIK